MNDPILYFNGLGFGEPHKRELSRLAGLERAGYTVTHAQVNWHSNEDFKEMMARYKEQATEIIRAMGGLTIVGYSAGGSLAINLLSNLRETSAGAVNIAGRLHRGSDSWYSYRKLERAAHLGTRRASHSFYDSVLYCEETVLPSLSVEDKTRIQVLKPRTDFVVPLDTMDIEGVVPVNLSAYTHNSSMRVGLNMLPRLLEDGSTAK